MELAGNANLAEAKKWLGLARQRSTSQGVEPEIGYVREYLGKAGATLADIGTSEEELAQLLLAGYRGEAVTWLKLARQRMNAAEVEYVRKYLVLANITPADIGTSEEELVRLAAKRR